MDDARNELSLPAGPPLLALQAWLTEARQEGALEPAATALATVSASGKVSNRIVQILEISEAGLLFASHLNSPKGRDIQTTGYAACVFYWPVLKRQVSVRGVAKLTSSQLADRLWRERPYAARAMSMQSRQSADLLDATELLRRVHAQTEADVQQRPEHWVGFILEAEQLEFWSFAADRLYFRVQYQYAEGHWSARRLQP